VQYVTRMSHQLNNNLWVMSPSFNQELVNNQTDKNVWIWVPSMRYLHDHIKLFLVIISGHWLNLVWGLGWYIAAFQCLLKIIKRCVIHPWFILGDAPVKQAYAGKNICFDLNFVFFVQCWNIGNGRTRLNHQLKGLHRVNHPVNHSVVDQFILPEESFSWLILKRYAVRF
jgi:hypothetical protein